MLLGNMAMVCNGYCWPNSRLQRIMQNCLWIPQSHGKWWAFGSITVNHSKRTLFTRIKTLQLLPCYNHRSADPFRGGKVWTDWVFDFKMYFFPKMCWSLQVLVGAIRAPRSYYSWNNQKPLWRTGPLVLFQHFSQAPIAHLQDYPVKLLGPWNPPWSGQIASTIKIRRRRASPIPPGHDLCPLSSDTFHTEVQKGSALCS